jgi:hypothetical protein
MKKQQKTYILLGAVLLIWGIIGVQIYMRINPPEPEIQPITGNSYFERKKTSDNVTYQLKPAYRDPFFGKFPIKKKKKKKKTKIVNKEPQKPFPDVVYNGVIKGAKKDTYILTINRKQYIVKKGEIVNNIKVIKGNSNEITLLFEKQQKVFEKQ